MPQTMLALLALMTATTMSLTWQRDSIRAQMNMIEAELQVEARGVVNEVFETVASLDFDQQTTGGATVNSTDDLSPYYTFGTNRTWGSVNDIDDLHNMRPYDMERTVTNPVTGEDAQVIFQIMAKVDYVDDASGVELRQSVGNARTFYKRFTVFVTPQIGYADSTRTPIEVSRVFSYDF